MTFREWLHKRYHHGNPEMPRYKDYPCDECEPKQRCKMPFGFELRIESGDCVHVETGQARSVFVSVSGGDLWAELSEKEARTIAIALNMAADELQSRKVEE